MAPTDNHSINPLLLITGHSETTIPLSAQAMNVRMIHINSLFIYVLTEHPKGQTIKWAGGQQQNKYTHTHTHKHKQNMAICVIQTIKKFPYMQSRQPLCGEKKHIYKFILYKLIF
jgi:hypothetical protein